MRAPVLACIGLSLALAACGPKGSNEPAKIETTSVDAFVVRHPTFEGHLDPKLALAPTPAPTRVTLVLRHSGFPDKSKLAFAGKAAVDLPRAGGEIETGLDLLTAAGDAPATALTGAERVVLPTPLPLELSFFGGRQKVTATLSKVFAPSELRACLEGAARAEPCTFPPEAPGSTEPNIVYFSKGDRWPTRFAGTPARVRDVDWIAIGEETPPVPGKTCKMQRTTSAGTPLEEELTLMRETERITVYDRRLAKELHVRDLISPDTCPVTQDVKLEGEKSGLRSPLPPAMREAWFSELRGEPDPNAPPPKQKPKPSPKPNPKPSKGRK